MTGLLSLKRTTNNEENVGMALVAVYGNENKKDGHKSHPYIGSVAFMESLIICFFVFDDCVKYPRLSLT